MKSNLHKVFDGIVDGAAREYFDENIECIEHVKRYAEAIGIELSSVEAQFIRIKAIEFIKRLESGELISTYDYYYDFEKLFIEIDEAS